MVALQCCMSAKDNYFRNFSQNVLFPETKLAAELEKKVSKYHKTFLWKTILWELKTFEAN